MRQPFIFITQLVNDSRFRRSATLSCLTQISRCSMPCVPTVCNHAQRAEMVSQSGFEGELLQLAIVTVRKSLKQRSRQAAQTTFSKFVTVRLGRGASIRHKIFNRLLSVGCCLSHCVEINDCYAHRGRHSQNVRQWFGISSYGGVLAAVYVGAALPPHRHFRRRVAFL